MDYRPVVVYINGEYYGLYDLREKICESYVSNRTGADEDTIDMIKGESILMSGSLTAYKELLQYVKTHDLSKQENYDHVASLVDVDELIDYWIAISFFGNTDTGNIKFYRERVDGAKWRWVVFDQDWALWPGTHTWNMVEEIINPNGPRRGPYVQHRPHARPDAQHRLPGQIYFHLWNAVENHLFHRALAERI